ncbi:FecCD family ABC transporter permease [Desulfitobacterium hafniense]|uniref:FecCD family ABC transporter permease n=1 Tax=Desulfitobacterium hafniense TaxID=49338 RepID=UPI000382632D|nr:iron ABC transporter permease [Desulfitobacterium hafniense]
MVNSERQKEIRAAHLRLMILAAMLIIVFLVSFNIGRFEGIPFKDTVLIMLSAIFPIEATWPQNHETVVLFIRFPRIMAAVLIGAALALSGACYQTVFKNPLVAPDILGASAGASLGAAIAIFSGLGYFYIQLFAFVFALGAVALACLVGTRIKRDPSLSLVLSGIFISSLASAIVSLIKFLADPRDKLPAITYWLMGSLSNITLTNIKWAIILMLIGAIPLFLVRWRLNVLSMGDDEAKTLGIETKQLRRLVIVCSTLLTAASISIGGLIGWVGLVIPHLMRRLVGPDNKVLIPATVMGGGVFLLLVDNVARSLTAVEIPLGVLTAIIGAPFFIGLMMYGREG